MKKIKRYKIVQISVIGETAIVCKDCDIHYSMEICEMLSKSYPQFRYEYIAQN